MPSVPSRQDVVDAIVIYNEDSTIPQEYITELENAFQSDDPVPNDILPTKFTFSKQAVRDRYDSSNGGTQPPDDGSDPRDEPSLGLNGVPLKHIAAGVAGVGVAYLASQRGG
jgi:hypothetical protein